MRFLVNSKYLLSKLRELNLEQEAVQEAIVKEDSLVLRTNHKEVEINLHPLPRYLTKVDPTGARWDWVIDHVSRIQEQPIVISFRENGVDLLSQF